MRGFRLYLPWLFPNGGNACRAMSTHLPPPPVPRRRSLPPDASADAVSRFQERLRARYGGPVDLRVNDNTSTLLSMRRPSGGGAVRFSVHRMFLDADDEVVEALAQYLRRPTTRSQRTLRAYMDARAAHVRCERPAPKALTLRARGRAYDLHAFADAVNAEWFEGRVRAYITWSRGSIEPRGTRRRHIIFGSWDTRTKLIRIHPALDSADVPEYFVKFVIYHEMLHAVMDKPRDPSCAGPRRIHTPEFRARERAHPDYDRSMAWERDFMNG